MKLLNDIIDSGARLGNMRKLMRYSANRSEGLQYGSYSLADEVALALSFANSCRGGGADQPVIDAGANQGDWSRLFLAGQPNIEKLIIVEPQSVHQTALRNLGKDNATIIIEQVAVGAAPGQLTLYADNEGSGLASLYERDLTHVGAAMTHQEVVQVTTLDALAEKHSLHHMAFLKLDLEGHELEALKGAKDLLNRKAIDAIAFEFGGCNIDSRTYIKDFWRLLVYQHQFSFYRLLPNQRLKRLSRYSETLEQFSWQNILACAPGIEPKWKVLD